MLVAIADTFATAANISTTNNESYFQLAEY